MEVLGFLSLGFRVSRWAFRASSLGFRSGRLGASSLGFRNGRLGSSSVRLRVIWSRDGRFRVSGLRV
jgi:hypothetical protein